MTGTNNGGEPPLTPQKLNVDRMTTNVVLYHIPTNGEAFNVESRSTRPLISQEQPYQRKGLRVSEDWEPIDLGWFTSENAGSVFIQNTTGFGSATIRKKEDQDIIDASILHVAPCKGAKTNPTTIRPGEGRLFDVLYPDQIIVSCVNGTANYSITIIAK